MRLNSRALSIVAVVLSVLSVVLLAVLYNLQLIAQSSQKSTLVPLAVINEDAAARALSTDKLLEIAREAVVNLGLQGKASEEIWHIVRADEWTLSMFSVALNEGPDTPVFIYSVKGEVIPRFPRGFTDGTTTLPNPEALTVALNGINGQIFSYGEGYLEDPIMSTTDQDRENYYSMRDTHKADMQTMQADYDPAAYEYANQLATEMMATAVQVATDRPESTEAQ